jgi:hypothetical protein
MLPDALDPQCGYTAEARLVARADQNAEIQLERGRGNGQVVGGDQGTGTLLGREDLRPALRRSRTEGYHRHPPGQRIDLRAPGSRARGRVRQADSGEQLRIDNGRQGDRLLPDTRERRQQAATAALGGNQCATRASTSPRRRARSVDEIRCSISVNYRFT